MSKVYVVIGGANFEGEDFKSLRLFDCFTAASVYMVELEKNYDYSLLDTREVIMGGALLCAA